MYLKLKLELKVGVFHTDDGSVKRYQSRQV